MSLIGFDDSDYAAEFGLTTIHQDPQALGRKAAEKALSLIDFATFGIDLGEPFETARTFLGDPQYHGGAPAVVGVVRRGPIADVRRRNGWPRRWRWRRNAGRRERRRIRRGWG